MRRLFVGSESTWSSCCFFITETDEEDVPTSEQTEEIRQSHSKISRYVRAIQSVSTVEYFPWLIN